ncbi:hypothetical protein GGF32_002812 [Allomyces javanicus]|nr:hypothetical protein GGF32_002812 [Allomyces javanicus]
MTDPPTNSLRDLLFSNATPAPEAKTVPVTFGETRYEFRIAHIIFGTDRMTGDDGSLTRPGGDAAAFVYHCGMLYQFKFTLDDDEARRHGSVHFGSGEGLKDRGFALLCVYILTFFAGDIALRDMHAQDQGGEGAGPMHDVQSISMQLAHNDHGNGSSPAYE